MIQSVRGFRDVYGKELKSWQKAEDVLKSSFSRWGFEEVRFPVLEKTELFQRGIGDDTDIVEKEMYTFADKGGEKVTLRPEGTASVIRFFNEHKLYGLDRFFKFFYVCPMFRYERPQKGRLRQFFQTGVEILGDGSPLAEGEAITILTHILDAFGIRERRLLINSLGCPACRPAYTVALTAFFRSREDRLCEDCVRRLGTNPLRLLDCKSDHCRDNRADAPRIAEHLCSDCSSHHNRLKQLLGMYGIAFTDDPFIVRGLDYYNRTVFEVHADGLGAQSAVLAGGRYDGLSESLGGKAVPAVGWAMGMERLISLLPDDFGSPAGTDVFFAFMGERAGNLVLPVLYQLRKNGVCAEYDIFGGSLKSQFRRADKLNSRKVVIIGENEINSGVFLLKDMKTGEQDQFPLDSMAETITKEL